MTELLSFVAVNNVANISQLLKSKLQLNWKCHVQKRNESNRKVSANFAVGNLDPCKYASYLCKCRARGAELCTLCVLVCVCKDQFSSFRLSLFHSRGIAYFAWRASLWFYWSEAYFFSLPVMAAMLRPDVAYWDWGFAPIEGGSVTAIDHTANFIWRLMEQGAGYVSLLPIQVWSSRHSAR